MQAKLELAQEEMFRHLTKMMNEGSLRPEVEEAMRQLQTLKGVDEVVQRQAKSLAELFVSKSGDEDVEVAKGMVRAAQVVSAEKRFQDALAASATEISNEFERTRADYSKNLGQLGQAVRLRTAPLVRRRRRGGA